MERGIKATELLEVKAGVEDGLGHGEAVAMISLYGVKDHDGDRVKKGSFDDFAEGLNGGEYPLSMVWQHGRDPFAHVGEVLELDPHARDDKGREGVAVKVRFDVDSDIAQARSTARQAYKLVKGRRVPQWSYAWEGDTTRLKDGSRELTNMRLSEVSPVLRGALSETHTVAIKQAADEDSDNDAADFQRTWSGIGDMIGTDADLVDWLSDANGTDVAGIVSCVAAYIANDVAREAYASAGGGDEDAGDTPYFKGVKRKFTQDERDRMAKSGVALEDGSWPIPDTDALDAAIAAYGRTGSQGQPNSKVKAHIIKRARALGAVSKLPDSWNVSKASSRDPFAQGAIVELELPELAAL